MHHSSSFLNRKPLNRTRINPNAADLRGSFIRENSRHSCHSRSIDQKYYFYLFLCIFDSSKENSMKKPLNWPKFLLIAGFIGMLIGMIDPLEGSVVILAGSLLLAISAYLDKSRRSSTLYLSFGMIALGVGMLFFLSSLGGVGGTSGRSWWWLLTVSPYPFGWILGIIGTILMLRDRSKVVKGEQ
jgi:hypothetical protein